MKPFVEGARKNLLPNRDRTVFFKDGQEFLPGIQAMSAPGHTVGHTVFMITSDGKTLAAIGDLTHHQVLLVEKPRIEFAYDTDSEAVGQHPRARSRHAGGQQHPAHRLSFPVAWRRPRGQAGRRLPLLPVASADGAGSENLRVLEARFRDVDKGPAAGLYLANTCQDLPQRRRSRLVPEFISRPQCVHSAQRRNRHHCSPLTSHARG